MYAQHGQRLHICQSVAVYELCEKAQCMMIMKVRGSVQFRLVLGVHGSANRVLRIHDCEHCMYHDGVSDGWFEGGIIVASRELANISYEAGCRRSIRYD